MQDRDRNGETLMTQNNKQKLKKRWEIQGVCSLKIESLLFKESSNIG